MDWQKNISLYIFVILLVLLGAAAATELQVGALVLALSLLVYYIWEEKLENCVLIKYIGLPFLVFGFLIMLWGLAGQIIGLATTAHDLILGGFYIELIGLVLFGLGYFVGYYRTLSASGKKEEK